MTATQPSHRRGQAVDAAIIEATLGVVAEQGTFQIRIDDVAERAGVNKTTIYRRYDSAEELVLAAVLHNAAAGIPMPDTGTLRGDLDALVRMVRAALTDPLGRALMQASGGGPLDELRRRYWAERFELASELIDRAAERGECAPVDDAAARIEALVAPIHFRIIQLAGVADDSLLAATVDRVIEELPSDDGSDR